MRLSPFSPFAPGYQSASPSASPPPAAPPAAPSASPPRGHGNADAVFSIWDSISRSRLFFFDIFSFTSFCLFRGGRDSLQIPARYSSADFGGFFGFVGLPRMPLAAFCIAHFVRDLKFLSFFSTENCSERSETSAGSLYRFILRLTKNLHGCCSD